MSAASLPIPSRRARIALGLAETAGLLAVAVWLGGLIALGAVAAPLVFGSLERETAGMVMGAIFARFDRVVLVAALVLAAAEVVRALAGGARGVTGRARLVLGAALVAIGLVLSLWLGPEIHDMFNEGVRRGVGPAGEVMDRMHTSAEALGKIAVVCAAAWIALYAIARRTPPRATNDASAAGSP